MKANAGFSHDAAYGVVIHNEITCRLLKNRQVGLVFQHAANGGFVADAVGLGTGCAHRWPFACVEHAKLDAA